MSEQTDNLLSRLQLLGLSEEEARIYLLLVGKGSLSALQVSREIHLARTKVYRILDNLIAKKLVTVQLGDWGKKFSANSYRELELLVKEKEYEAQKLKAELPLLFQQMGELWGSGQARSKVKYYSNTDGLEQVTWNSLNAKEPLRIYEVEQDMSVFLDPGFSEKIREELVFNKITTLQLTNKKHIEPYTKIAELVKKFWEVCYLAPKELEIKFEVLIYNDVVAMYNFKGEDKFCVEIYNENLAQMQKQLFDFVWEKARKMKIIGEHGEAKVDEQ